MFKKSYTSLFTVNSSLAQPLNSIAFVFDSGNLKTIYMENKTFFN